MLDDSAVFLVNNSSRRLWYCKREDKREDLAPSHEVLHQRTYSTNCSKWESYVLDLRVALSINQLAAGDAERNRELVVDPSSVVAKLPFSILAFWHKPTDEDASRVATGIATSSFLPAQCTHTCGLGSLGRCPSLSRLHVLSVCRLMMDLSAEAGDSPISISRLS